MRGAPSPSATTLEPSLTTTRLIAELWSFIGRARRTACALSGGALGSSSKVTPAISISSPGWKPSASSARSTPIRRSLPSR